MIYGLNMMLFHGYLQFTRGHIETLWPVLCATSPTLRNISSTRAQNNVFAGEIWWWLAILGKKKHIVKPVKSPKVKHGIWANYNNSLSWNKAILGWFLLLTMIPVRSQWGRYNLPRWHGISMAGCSWWWILWRAPWFGPSHQRFLSLLRDGSCILGGMQLIR